MAGCSVSRLKSNSGCYHSQRRFPLTALGNHVDRFYASQHSASRSTLLLAHPGGYTEAEANNLTTRRCREPWGTAFGWLLRLCRRIRLEQLSGSSGSSLSVTIPVLNNGFEFHLISTKAKLPRATPIDVEPRSNSHV